MPRCGYDYSLTLMSDAEELARTLNAAREARERGTYDGRTVCDWREVALTQAESLLSDLRRAIETGEP